MPRPNVLYKKLREQQVGTAFIETYNREHGTDYSIYSLYNNEFPDLKFRSASGSGADLFAEVVEVVESEEEKAQEKFVARLRAKLKSELKKSNCKDIVVAILYQDLPSAALLKAWVDSVSRYVLDKIKDTQAQQFRFDRVKDGRSFWEMSHIKNSIRSLQIKLVHDFDDISVLLMHSQGRQIFPEAYLHNAIQKKSRKYAPSSVKGITLLLDCNFPLIDETDMTEFAQQATRINPGFKEIWCVNILSNQKIVERVA